MSQQQVETAKVENVDQADEAFLASLGYKQEFKREFKPFELFGLSFSMIGMFPLPLR